MYVPFNNHDTAVNVTPEIKITFTSTDGKVNDQILILKDNDTFKRNSL